MLVNVNAYTQCTQHRHQIGLHNEGTALGITLNQKNPK